MLSRFYADVLPQSGSFALWTKHDKQHEWVGSQEELVEATMRTTDMLGVYFATAAFDNEGKRKQVNVTALRSFRFDFDAGEAKLAKHGEDKVYPTQQDAIADVVRFAKETGLVPTYIVSSGEGLHVYYCMTQDIDPLTWNATAQALSQLAVQHGLKQDHSVTTDSARVLRPIGSLHDNGKLVTVLKRSEAFYGPSELAQRVVSQLDAPLVVASAARRFEGVPNINDDVLTVQGPPKSVKKIFANCGAFAEAARARGNVEEPYWRAMLGLVKHTVEGDKAAHYLSQGYSGYDAGETQKKLDAWATGPATCNEFAKYSKACGTCPHQGKIKSPIVLGAMTTPEIEKLPDDVRPPEPEAPAPTGDPWDGNIPARFEVKVLEGVKTLVFQMPTEKENENGDTVPVIVPVPFTTDIFWFSQWADAYDSNDTAQASLVKWDGAERSVYVLDQTLIANQQRFREFLAGKSIILTSHPKAPKAMEEYAKAQLSRIKMLGKRPKVGDHLGLRILPNGDMICAHGKYVIYPDGRIIEGILSPQLQVTAQSFQLNLPAEFTGEWSPAVWDSHIAPRAAEYVSFLKRFYGQPGMERFQLAIMMGLASPFMAFVTGAFHSGSDLPATGLSVSLFETRGGRGKTTAVKASVLAYGNPETLAPEVSRGASTDNARRQILTYLGTMPSVMDELGRAGTAVVVDMISSVANGAPRIRMTKDLGVNMGSRWALVNLITTNTSQRSMISAEPTEANSAVQNRLLEINVENMPEFNAELREAFGAEWSRVSRNSAGTLGAMIHREICAMGHEEMNRVVLACVARASKILDTQEARFQYRGLGALMALHLILNRMGMVAFDLQGMIDTYRAAFDHGKEYTALNVLPSDGAELLARCLMDLRHKTVITENETRIGRNSGAHDIALNARVPDTIVARHVRSTHTTYIAAAALRQWCADSRVSEIDMIRTARERGALKLWYPQKIGEGGRAIEYFDLSKGMRDCMTLRLRCYRVDTARLATLTGSGVDEELAGGDNVVQMPQRAVESASDEAAPTGTAE
jgi:hypothetical protein